MLYLYKNYQEFNGVPRKCLKIGYTNNINSRKKVYRTSNGSRGVKLLGTKEGSKLFESMFHLIYRNQLLINEDSNRRSEWCLWSQKIVNSFFTETEQSLSSKLWKDREKYLIPILKESKKARDIYNYLELINKEEIINHYVLNNYLELPKYISKSSILMINVIRNLISSGFIKERQYELSELEIIINISQSCQKT